MVERCEKNGGNDAWMEKNIYIYNIIYIYLETFESGPVFCTGILLSTNLNRSYQAGQLFGKWLQKMKGSRLAKGDMFIDQDIGRQATHLLLP